MIYKNTVVFDFETTGLDPHKDRIIEVAAIKIVNGKIQSTFSQLLNPEIDVPEFITNLTGIRNEDVQGAPTMKEVIPWLMTMFERSLLVAHNALFDLSFLEANTQRHLGISLQNQFIDTRTICIDQFPYQSHKLEVMCKQLDIPLTGAHRALNDVMATWELLKKLGDRTDLEPFINRLYFFKKYGRPDWAPEYSNVVGI